MSSEETLYRMSDEELEAQYLKEKEDTNNEQVQAEEEVTDDVSTIQESSDDSDTELKPDNDNEVATQDVGEDNTSVEEPPKVEVPQTYKAKANGKEYEFSLDDLIKLAPKAIDYTKKMQAIAPHRKAIEAMEENGLSTDDINRFIDIKKGKKEAIVNLLKELNVDIYDLPQDSEEVKYTPTEYGKDETYYKVQEVIDELQGDEVFNRTQEVINELDKTSKRYLFEDPEAIKGLHIDIKSGMFDKIRPQAEKMAAIDGYHRPFLDYYLIVGQDVYKQQNEAMRLEQERKAKENQELVNRKKNASLPTSSPTTKKVINYLDDISDEDYDAWYKAKISSKY